MDLFLFSSYFFLFGFILSLFSARAGSIKERSKMNVLEAEEDGGHGKGGKCNSSLGSFQSWAVCFARVLYSGDLD